MVGWSFKWPDERVWVKKCMEHEWDWPVFGNPLIDERGKRCRGGKNSKERATWAFFVTASGEKDTRTVVGRSLNQRCFKSLKNNSRLCKCDYFSSSRAWMASEIFERVSFQVDELTATYSCFLTMRLVAPISLSTASGIWRWLCWNYQTLESEKKGKTYVCSKIDRQKTASEIVKSVNLLIAIQWGKKPGIQSIAG